MPFEQPTIESVEKEKKPSEIKTEMGSVYKYLPDGRTQRFKRRIENGEEKVEISEPQDVLVFIPPWEKIKDRVKEAAPMTLGLVENKAQYDQYLLRYAQEDDYTIRPLNREGKELKNNKEIEEADEVFLRFIDKKNPKNNFELPVSKDPIIGYQTFDTRKFVDKDGETKRARHIGNSVVDIVYAS